MLFYLEDGTIQAEEKRQDNSGMMQARRAESVSERGREREKARARARGRERESDGDRGSDSDSDSDRKTRD